MAFGRDGAELARYRKLHLFDVVTPDGREYRESALVGRGRDVVTYAADGVRVGCSICYDLRFGELYRRLAAEGAQLVMVPAAFTLQTGKDHWEVLLRARAIETQCFVAAAAQVGSFQSGRDTRQNWGHAMILDPWGKVLAQVPDRPGLRHGQRWTSPTWHASAKCCRSTSTACCRAERTGQPAVLATSASGAAAAASVGSSTFSMPLGNPRRINTTSERASSG